MNSVKLIKGKGSKTASVMFVGEAPGDYEDKLERPFAGTTEKLLDNMIDILDISKKDVYMTNVIKVKIQDNKTPTYQEIFSWFFILDMEIKMVNPSLIIALGKSATMSLLGKSVKMIDVRGSFRKRNGKIILPTYHPTYLLKNPNVKSIVKKDLTNAKEFLKKGINNYNEKLV